MMPGMIAPAVQPRSHLVTDFREYSTGSNLDAQGWTETGDASGNMTWDIQDNNDSLSGRRLLADKTSSSSTRFITWDYVGTQGTVQILARLKIVEFANTTGFLVARLTDNNNYYICLPRDLATDVLEIGEETGGTQSAVANTAFTWNTTDWFWVRFQLNGTALKAKAWTYGDAEPGTWTVETTDNSHSTGKVGFATFNVTGNYLCDFFSVALNGATAPFPSG
jgi:hypothetical protein